MFQVQKHCFQQLEFSALEASYFHFFVKGVALFFSVTVEGVGVLGSTSGLKGISTLEASSAGSGLETLFSAALGSKYRRL